MTSAGLRLLSKHEGQSIQNVFPFVSIRYAACSKPRAGTEFKRVTFSLTGVPLTLNLAEHSSEVMNFSFGAPQNGQKSGWYPTILKPHTVQTYCYFSTIPHFCFFSIVKISTQRTHQQ